MKLCSTDQESELAGKLKRVHKHGKKHSVVVNEEIEFADAVGETNSGSMKKLHKNKRKKHASANEETELLPKGGESKRDSTDQVSTGECKSPGGTKNKLKKTRKSKRKDQSSSEGKNKSGEKGDEPYEIYQISSGEEDCSRGMRKWVEEYYTNRVGLEVLQQRIDDLITEHEEQEEQARKDKEAKIAEDGWTVVVHRKGGKKTNDPESGVSVGSVSQGAVLHKMDKKKTKEVGPDFYRFQRREAQQSAVMKNRSLFEEDRKRIQQLRAARKFKPY